MNRRGAVVLAIALLGATVPAVGVVIGGTNLGPMGYPQPVCRVPYAPYDSRYSIDSDVNLLYRMERDQYVKCVNEYVENADHDIERIREQADKAIETAKRDLAQ